MLQHQGPSAPDSQDALPLAFIVPHHKGLSRGGTGGAQGHGTFVPVLEGRHDEEADGLVGSLLEDSRG